MRAMTMGAAIGLMMACLAAPLGATTAGTVRVKELARVDGVRDNPLAGYGLVVGLAGTGDSTRSRATTQAVANALLKFGTAVPGTELNTRNVAAVFVTATLPPFANVGDRIDVHVSSIGDARSLAGGTLLMTPLEGPNNKVYGLAQGPLSVGGYRYDAFGNLVQKNHPNVGIVAGGGTVEASALNTVVSRGGALHLLLHAPDFTTSARIAEALAAEFGSDRMGKDITAEGPDRIVFRLSERERTDFVSVLRRIENVSVVPDRIARVVVNERTGTVVAGGDVRIGQVTVTQGDLKVRIDTDFLVSQPALVSRTGPDVRTAVVPSTQIKSTEPEAQAISLPQGTAVADLVQALGKIKATPRDIITILQSIQRAGALHGELVVQ